MFNNFSAGMSIAVNGGSAEENSQLCTVVAAALRTAGFRDVNVAVEYPMHTTHDADTISAMRHLNPDLFDTSIVIEGESEDEMRMNMAAMGYAGQPFSFGIERPSY
jgi:sulfur carrier protein ThiS